MPVNVVHLDRAKLRAMIESAHPFNPPVSELNLDHALRALHTTTHAWKLQVTDVLRSSRRTITFAVTRGPNTPGRTCFLTLVYAPLDFALISRATQSLSDCGAGAELLEFDLPLRAILTSDPGPLFAPSSGRVGRVELGALASLFERLSTNRAPVTEFPSAVTLHTRRLSADGVSRPALGVKPPTRRERAQALGTLEYLAQMPVMMAHGALKPDLVLGDPLRVIHPDPFAAGFGYDMAYFCLHRDADSARENIKLISASIGADPDPVVAWYHVLRASQY